MNRGLRIALGVLIGALTVAGCLDSADESSLEAELAAFEQQLLDHEETIAECMTAQGFSYEIGLPASWHLEKAYQLDVAAGGTGLADVEIPEEANEAYLSSLDPGELEAFDFAFWGDIDIGGTERGCYAATYESVWGFDPFSSSMDVLASALDLRAAVEEHPDVVAALDRYLNCMADEGYDLADYGHIYEVVPIPDSPESPDDEAYRRAAYSAHDACRVDYDSIYDRVHLELAAKQIRTTVRLLVVLFGVVVLEG